jgi:hypothetical protein
LSTGYTGRIVNDLAHANSIASLLYWFTSKAPGVRDTQQDLLDIIVWSLYDA